MNDDNETLDFGSRLEICNIARDIRTTLRTVKFMLKNADCSDYSDTLIDDVFGELYESIEEIIDSAWGSDCPTSLFAAPQQAFNCFRAVSEHQLQKEREAFMNPFPNDSEVESFTFSDEEIEMAYEVCKDSKPYHCGYCGHDTCLDRGKRFQCQLCCAESEFDGEIISEEGRARLEAWRHQQIHHLTHNSKKG